MTGKRINKKTKARHQKKKEDVKRISKDRIKTLFKQAVDTFKENSKLSDRYVTLARKIAMKYKIKFTSTQKRKFCKHCYCFLMPGKNCTVRTTGKTITYSCKNCKKFTRISYKKKSSE
ncbi:ribonuclease P [Candidatus Woesearchaeota archaeon]|nr:ribonuclease P [Candidatus Woesearchaeota archaeon]MBT5271829.1 ribonuclease P [Candidatus Woesearchaeota archaeon]MBT6040735.1 ribonuclease P [Candidatus Woesearchaeota archaeon]MBT6337456.1 ribonuclease P [Candidatus Woesearchaeota archaeon]MBT7927982.1 ribonuclease P [Candidatus Woesearchaeota archaeon]